MLESSSCRKANRHRGSFDSASSTDVARAKKARASSPAEGFGGGSSDSFGGCTPSFPSSGAKTLGIGLRTRIAHPAAIRHNATWSPGGTHRGATTSTTTKTAPVDAADIDTNNPFLHENSNGACQGVALEGCQDRHSSEARWGEWTTICKTGKHRETVELPQATISSSGQAGPAVPLGLRYRVGSRRRDGERRFAFR